MKTERILKNAICNENHGAILWENEGNAARPARTVGRRDEETGRQTERRTDGETERKTRTDRPTHRQTDRTTWRDRITASRLIIKAEFINLKNFEISLFND